MSITSSPPSPEAMTTVNPKPLRNAPLDRRCLSIIVPIYNEEENLPELHRRLNEFAAKQDFDDIEVIFVSDGSRDASEPIIAQYVEESPLFKGVFLTRNYGHQAAVSTGMKEARGSVIAIIDGDLQDPPEEIEKLVQALDEGADVAYGVRTKRKENILKRVAYSSFYMILRRVAEIEIPLDSGDFCCMRREVLEKMLLLPEKNRFVRGLRAWVGLKQVPVVYEREARFAGEPKYTMRKLIGLAYDGIFSFSYLPIRLMQFLGFATSALSLTLAFVYILIWAITGGANIPQGWTTLVISVWFIGGIQLLFMGLLGEYVYRTFDEVRSRPTALVREVLSHEDAAS